MVLDKVIGVEEASDLWGLSPGYLKNLCAEGKVLSKKIGKTWVIDKTQVHPALLPYIKNIQGGTFIKEINITKDSKMVQINYFDSFEEYINHNSQSKLDCNDYNNYFETGDKVNKILVEESVRLLRQFHFLESININIPYLDNEHIIKINRKELNDYLGYKVEDLEVQDRTWHTKFLEKHAYPKAQRDKFLSKFVTTKQIER
ncbi:helix-turn-helix domain-containing protein [Aquibacillus saliphilus]|uniref:helix-turn-helix domain-containing protein n=1 Tax=Aquibacillus saliphilus TaxID=1909422 RepID=UPI001CEFF738|nr:helix-turn-helix domain-containing protein [Aquibacillus saliphilus]